VAGRTGLLRTRDAERGAPPLPEILLEHGGSPGAARVLAVTLVLLHRDVIAVEYQLQRLQQPASHSQQGDGGDLRLAQTGHEDEPG